MNPIDVFEFGLKTGLSKDKSQYVYTPHTNSKIPECYVCKKEAQKTKIIENKHGQYLCHIDLCNHCYETER